MKFFLVWIVFLAYALSTSELLIANHPAWDGLLDHYAIEHQLRDEPIKVNISLAEFLKERGIDAGTHTTIRFITLESGLKAVFKQGCYKYAEVAAYKASKVLGLRLVPPTVMRIIDEKEGSLQFFVESRLTSTSRRKYLKKLSPKDVSDMKVFYFVFGQWDNHAENQVIAKQKKKVHLALIDNAGIIFRQRVQYGDFPFVFKGKNSKASLSLDADEFPFSRAKKIIPHSPKKMHHFLAPYISEADIHRIWSGHHHYISSVKWNAGWWMQMNKDKRNAKPAFTSTYYRSTLEALEKLDKEALREIWAEGYATDTAYFEELIEQTLERRDQLLRHAHEHGTIIDESSIEKSISYGNVPK